MTHLAWRAYKAGTLPIGTAEPPGAPARPTKPEVMRVVQPLMMLGYVLCQAFRPTHPGPSQIDAALESLGATLGAVQAAPVAAHPHAPGALCPLCALQLVPPKQIPSMKFSPLPMNVYMLHNLAVSFADCLILCFEGWPWVGGLVFAWCRLLYLTQPRAEQQCPGSSA